MICTNCNEIMALNARTKPRHSQKQPFCSRKCCEEWQSLNLKIDHGCVGKKQCTHCGEEKKLTEFNKKGNRLHAYCKNCLYDYQTYRQNMKKVRAVEHLGGSCNKCGDKDHPALFDFHHTGEQKKEYDWSMLRNKKWDTIEKELSKCILICQKCHRKEHINWKLWEWRPRLDSNQRPEF